MKHKLLKLDSEVGAIIVVIAQDKWVVDLIKFCYERIMGKKGGFYIISEE